MAKRRLVKVYMLPELYEALEVRTAAAGEKVSSLGSRIMVRYLTDPDVADHIDRAGAYRRGSPAATSDPCHGSPAATFPYIHTSIDPLVHTSIDPSVHESIPPNPPEGGGECPPKESQGDVGGLDVPVVPKPKRIRKAKARVTKDGAYAMAKQLSKVYPHGWRENGTRRAAGLKEAAIVLSRQIRSGAAFSEILAGTEAFRRSVGGTGGQEFSPEMHRWLNKELWREAQGMAPEASATAATKNVGNPSRSPAERQAHRQAKADAEGAEPDPELEARTAELAAKFGRGRGRALEGQGAPSGNGREQA